MKKQLGESATSAPLWFTDDIVEGLRVILQRRGCKIQQGDILCVEQAIAALCKRASRSETATKFTREDAAKLVERKAKDLTEEYCHGDAGPGGYTWTNKEAEWQVILLDELAEEIRNAKGI